jgi:hypothetical protein
MAKTKTIKIAAIDPNKFERIDVPQTGRVDPSKLNLTSSFDDEIANLSYEDFEYKLKFETTDATQRDKIKLRMKELKNK